MPLFLLALVFLFLLFWPYTFFLIFGQFLHYLPRKRGLHWIHGTLVTTILDAYRAPYSKHYQFWTGLGLLVRCCLLTIFSVSNSIRINLMSVSIVVTVLFSLQIATRNKIYIKKLSGLLELFYLSNLEILSVVLITDDKLCSVLATSVSLSLAVFTFIFIYHLHLEVGRSFSGYLKLKQAVHNILLKRSQNTNQRPEDDLNSTKFKKSSTNFLELRESLIDSTN